VTSASAGLTNSALRTSLSLFALRVLSERRLNSRKMFS
jgi:hypothetical protein